MITNTPLSIVVSLFGADLDEPENALIAYTSKSEIERIATIEVLNRCIEADNLLELDEIINVDDFKDHDHRVLFLKDLRKHHLEGGPIPSIEDYLIE